jgi:hypothetical protein
MRESGGVMNEFVKMLKSHPIRSLSENEQQRLNQIRFSRSIGSNNSSEALNTKTRVQQQESVNLPLSKIASPYGRGQ